MRIVLVTRRFWPLVGGAEVLMANLAAEFLRQGAYPVILTAQWEESWPESVVFGEVPVVRLCQPKQRVWGTLRYARALRRWLKQNCHEIDVVYVSMLKHDAYMAIGACAGGKIPVVLRAEGAGSQGDCRWQQNSILGRCVRARCRQADAFVAISSTIESEMIEAGYRRSAICRIDNGVARRMSNDDRTRAAARRDLTDASPQFAIPDHGRLAVYTGRLHEAKGIETLITAWIQVSQRWPEARLWLVGDGPHAAALRQRVESLGMKHQIVFPGVIDSTADVLHVADLFVLPSLSEGLSISLLEAMASFLPIVATDIPANRAVITHQTSGILFPPGDTQALAAAIIRLWDNPNLARRFAEAAQIRVRSHFSLDSNASQHLELFHGLIENRGQR